MEDEGVTVLFLQVEGRAFAVEVCQVETLRRKETVFPAYQGPPDLLGFLPLGGAIVPIVDLGARLGILQEAIQHTGLLVVPPQEVASLAFRVDQVVGPVHLLWQELSLLPGMLRELQPRPLTWAMAWQGEKVVPILDLAQVVPPEEAAVLMGLAAEIVQQ
jgi:purine-binding chemotaxis protein CheW